MAEAKCIYCGHDVDLEDGRTLIRMDADGNVMAAHPKCLARHRPGLVVDGELIDGEACDG